MLLRLWAAAQGLRHAHAGDRSGDRRHDERGKAGCRRSPLARNATSRPSTSSSTAPTNSPCSSSLPDPNPPAVPPANACFKPYTVGITPADLAMATSTNGMTVPYIVRVERGTINRGIYDIASLFDPTSATPRGSLATAAVEPQVVYTFGASTGQPRLQFRTEQNWADDAALRGFMVVDNSLTDSLYNSNRTLNAETLMMMKEHIVARAQRDRLHDRQRLLRRVDPAEHRGLDRPGLLGGISRAATTPIRSPRGSRSPTACCW